MPIDLESLSSAALWVAAFLGAFITALWLSLVIWTFRDMRARSRDVLAQILAAAVVAVLNLPGLIIYLILRPPKTLAEQYEQSLEEEALLQEIEDRRVCPGCSRQVQEDWQLCPNCLTKLKKSCENCGKLLDLPWTVCPYCAHVVARGPEPEAPGPESQTTAEPEASVSNSSP